MNYSLKNENAIREYLLGRVADETRLAEFEELLFLDEEFAELAEIVEDSLINDFVFARLDEKDARAFSKTLENNGERRAKVGLTRALKEKAKPVEQVQPESAPTFFDSIQAFFRKPLNLGAFAVVLLAVVGLSWILLNRSGTSELAELKTIYGRERAVETRLADFEYAPLNVTRGETEERERNKLRRIENELLEAVEKNPSALAHHALGVFYLTQRKFDDALKELEKAVKTDDRNARILNDLGSAYFEKAKTEPPEKRLETLAKALENFGRANETDAGFLPALFNKALCLQELKLDAEARAAWQKYLEKDPRSGWSNEARKNLERLDAVQKTSKSKEQVLEDFLNAFRARDTETAWRINSETREMISGVWLADQLTNAFLEAKVRGDDGQAVEKLEALKFIGVLEKERNADFFVFELAEFYEQTTDFENLSEAKKFLADGFASINEKKIGQARSNFEQSRKLFERSGNLFEAKVSALWTAHALTDLSAIKQSDEILEKLAEECEARRYRWLKLAVLDWAANNLLLRNEFTKAFEINKQSLQTAEELGDAALRSKMSNVIAARFNDLGENDKALTYLGKLVFAPNVYRRNEIRNWQTNFYVSAVFSKLEMPETAESFGREALFNVQNSPLKNSQAVDDTFRLLMDVKRTKNDFPKALEFAREALRFAENTADESFRQRLTQYVTLEIAELTRLTGNYAEALEGFEKALELLRKNPEVELDNYAAEKGKLLCLLALEKNVEIDAQLDRTLALSENFRARLLDDETRNAFFENEQFVFDAAVENALRRRFPQKAFELAEMSKARTLLDFVQGENSVNELEKRFPEVAKPLMFGELQNALPPEVQIIEYFVLKDKLVIWRVTKDRFDLYEKAVSSEMLAQKTTEFLRLIIQMKAKPDELQNAAGELYEMLVEPLEKDLQKDQSIVFVPDESLFKVPFAALFNKAAKRFLIEDFTISYAPSANVFAGTTQNARQRETSKAAEKLLIVGNPQFDRAAHPNLLDLPSADEEARKIAEFYGQKRLLTSAQATKEAVLKEISQTEVFHFAGHYVTNEASTPNSKILLAGTSEESVWRVSEIAEKRLLKTKFVVLSACETNGEKVFQAEGAVGVARAFLAVGAPLVVAGNWKVDSEASKDLMVSFHSQRRQNDLKIPEALRQAQLAMLKTKDFQAPYFWAAFAVVGGFANY